MTDRSAARRRPSDTANLIVINFGKERPPRPEPRSVCDRGTCLFVDGPQQGAVLALTPGDSTVIGRGMGADFRLPEDTVSREHARISWDPLPNGPGYLIEDLGTPGGTWVDGRKIGAPTRLHEGCRVHLGPRVSFRFELHDASEQAAMVGLNQAAMKDALTGAYTRRYLHDRLRAELSYAARHDVSAAVAMFDIDHFKRVNDRYGHAAGDAVLRVVAAQLRRMLRPEDVLIRYGGEEFCVLLRGLDIVNAQILANRLRVSVEGLEVRWGADRAPIRVTVSAGVAASRPEEAPQALVERADAALYVAKRSGRNRVVRSQQG